MHTYTKNKHLNKSKNASTIEHITGHCSGNDKQESFGFD